MMAPSMVSAVVVAVIAIALIIIIVIICVTIGRTRPPAARQARHNGSGPHVSGRSGKGVSG